jgi:hypothetical protein
MTKAILELDMPNSCQGCPFHIITDVCKILSHNKYNIPAYTPDEGRRDDCPLREVMHDDEENICYSCKHMFGIRRKYRRKYIGGVMLKCIRYEKGETDYGSRKKF